MLTRGLKQVKIEDIEDTIMSRILEVQEGLKKGRLSLEYSASTVRKPIMERILADLDEDLKSLRKELEDAKAQKQMLLNQGMSPNDPMLDILEFQIESAQSALDTRLLELKADQKLMDKATLLLKQEEEWFAWVLERNQKLDAEKKKMMMEEKYLKELKRELEKKKQQGLNFIYMLIGLNILAWIRQQNIRISQKLENIRKSQQNMYMRYQSMPNARG